MLLLSFYYHKKRYRIYLLFSAQCGNASSIAVGACFVMQLSDFKPGCYASQHRFNMCYHVASDIDQGREMGMYSRHEVAREKERDRLRVKLFSDGDNHDSSDGQSV